MPKTISTALESHIGQETTTLATCWKLVRKDGKTYGFTSHDQDIVYSGVLYEAAAGLVPTDITISSGLNVDSVDVSSFFQEAQINEVDIMAGRFDGATVDIFKINYKSTTDGVLYLARGWLLGEITLEDNQFTVELRGKAQKLQQNIVEQYGPMCRARLGDDRCQINVESDYTVTGSITEVVNRRNFIDSSRTETEDVFAGGVLTLTGTTGGDPVAYPVSLTNPSFETGDLTGWTTSSGTPELVTAIPYTLKVPYDGTYMVRGLSTANYAIKQEVDLVSGVGVSAVSIDAGLYRFRMAAYLHTSPLMPYPAYIKLTFKDSARETLTTAESEHIMPTEWYLLRLFATIPEATRYVDVELVGDGFSGAGGDPYQAYFDKVSAAVEEYSPYDGYSMEVKSFDPDTKNIELFLPFPFELVAGANYFMTWGCDHTTDMCKDRFSNLINFRGEPFIPGTNTLKTAVDDTEEEA